MRSLLLLGEKFRNSFRNSSRTLGSSKDDSSKEGNEEEPAPAPKHVQFPSDDEILTREIPPREGPITEDEIQRNWYKNDDYTRFKKDRVLTSIGYLSSKKFGAANFDINEHAIRGLEALTDDRLNRKELGRKRALKKAVREEEERQKLEHSFPDMEKFRVVSLQHTKASRDRALAIANEDAKQVRPRTLLYNRSISLRRLKNGRSPVRLQVPSSD